MKVLDKTKKKTRSKKKKRDTNKSSDSSVSRSRRETANMSVNNVMSSIKLPKKLNLFLGQHNGDNFLAFFDLSGQKTLTFAIFQDTSELTFSGYFPYSFREPLSKAKLESIDHWFTMKSFVKIIEYNLKTFVGSKYKTTSGYI